MFGRRWRFAWLIIILSLFSACGTPSGVSTTQMPATQVPATQVPATQVSVPEVSVPEVSVPEVEQDAVVDLCAVEVDLGLNIGLAATAPVFVEGGTELGQLGEEGARALAAQMVPPDDFCSYAVSARTQEVLEQVEALAREGKLDQARDLMRARYEELVGATNGVGVLAAPQPQPAGDVARGTIRDLFEFAEQDQALGLGDGQKYMDAAKAEFQELADQELSSGNLDKTMRILDEAQSMGESEIAERALKQAQDIVGEALEAAIKDFDPCLDNPEILGKEIADLLNLLGQAMLLGVDGAWGPGEALYDAAVGKANAGMQQVASLNSGGAKPPPKECRGYAFEFSRSVSDGLTMTGSAYTCGGVRGPWTGEMELSGISVQGEWEVETSGSFEFAVPEGENTVQIDFLTTGIGRPVRGGGYGDITDPIRLTFTLVDRSTAQIIIGSTGEGTIVVHVRGVSYPVHPFATVWTAEPVFTVVLQRYSGCE